MPKNPQPGDRDEVFNDLGGGPDEPSLPEDSDILTTMDEAIRQGGRVIAPEDDEPETDEDAEPAYDDDEYDNEGPPDAEPEPEPLSVEPAAAPPDETHELGRQLFERDAANLVEAAQNVELREAIATTEKTRAQATIQRSIAARKAAKEAGDTDAEIKAEEDAAEAREIITKADQVLQGVNQSKVKLRETYADLQRRAGEYAPAAARQAQPQRQPVGSKLAPTFIEKNKTFFADPKYAAHRAALFAEDVLMHQEGKADINSTQYFSELARRFNKRYPGLLKDLNGNPVAAGSRVRGNGANTSAPASAQAPRSTAAKKVLLTQDDIDLMRKFKMDPDNKEHRRQVLADKRALAGGGRE